MADTVKLADGIFVEQLGGEVLVFITSGDVARLTGDAADIVLGLQAGRPVDLNHPMASDLVDRRILVVPGLSRRGLITAGAAGAVAGITMVAMPGAAMASSGTSAVLPEQFIELNGYIQLYLLPEPEYFFAIDDSFELPNNWPDPQPSNDVDDIGNLELLGTTFSVTGADLGDSDLRVVLWGSVVDDPGPEVAGIFTSNGSETRLRVTFINEPR
jgi:hypothetical protein